MLEDFASSDANLPPIATICDGFIFDRFLPVNILQQFKGMTAFKKCFSNTFAPHVLKQIVTVKPIYLDLVWDTYIPNSLKDYTRQKKGSRVELYVYTVYEKACSESGRVLEI